MKRIVTSLVCISLILTPHIYQAKCKRISLQEALQNKLVSMKAQSLGGHSGYCMEVQLKNLNPDSLEVLLEPGYKLNSVKEVQQDILVIKEAVFVMRKGEEKKQTVYGFCCQNHNLSPSKGAMYNDKAKQDEKLKMLARFLNTTKFPDNIVQQSVWAISDSIETASIGETGRDSQLVKLRGMVSAIKGEPVPDYSILQKTYTSPAGRIYMINMAIKGSMSFSNSKYQYCYFKVFDATNQQVSEETGQWLDSGNGARYEFYVPAKELAKGVYTLKLVSEGGEALGEKKVRL
jgi:hypothetical protein